MAAPTLWQRGGGGSSFAAAWRPAWRWLQQLCSSVGLAVMAGAVQQEEQRQCGSGGGGSMAAAAWRQLGGG
jgi:hypothetical protein